MKFRILLIFNEKEVYHIQSVKGEEWMFFSKLTKASDLSSD